MATDTEKRQEALALFEKAKLILEDNNASSEARTGTTAMFQDAVRLQAEADQLSEIARRTGDILAHKSGPAREAPKFASFGQFLKAVAQSGNVRYRGALHPALRQWDDKNDMPGPIDPKGVGTAWEEQKVLQEGVGATGGFLVPTEYRAELYALPAPNNEIRRRATIIPMRRRQIEMPVLDQTSTTAGSPHWFGGISATWTEESGYKAEHDPSFRKISLVAHKLVCYTLASDELLDDEAVGLVGFFTGQMGFAGAINWEEEYTFLRGTGVGQPLGIINAACTIVVPRVAMPAVSLQDIVNMVMHSYGDPVWHISRSQFANLLLINGPAANPSYVFIPNAREGVPSTLFGFPILWCDKLPTAGTQGDVCLCDWRYYLIGDRQATTIDSTNAEYFRYDETSWRAVHRVDGQPWLSTWFTYQDGVTDVSPFVILGDKTT